MADNTVLLFGRLKIKPGCVILGAVSLMLSIVLNLSTILLLANGVSETEDHISKHNKTLTISGIQTLRRQGKEAVLWVLLAIGVILFCVSILLIVGVKKCKPGFVLPYFGFGILLSIVVFLSALLELIKSFWVIGLCELIFIAFYIPCLVMVYSVHEHLFMENNVDTDYEELLDDSFGTN